MSINAEKLEAASRHIPNLRVVSNNLVRGGQPQPEGLKVLKDAGVKVVINLRSTESGLVSLFRKSATPHSNPELEAEKKAARELGMKFIQIPLDVFGHPDEEHLDEFLSFVTGPECEPAFVHCLHGRDRTGLMLAVYRVVSDNWPVEKAYHEMIECGFDAERTNLSDALFAFAKKRCPR